MSTDKNQPRHTGIAAVVQATEWLTAQPRPGREAFEGHFLHRVLSDEQILELELRIGVELGFEELVKAELTDAEIRGLNDVFFGLLYPLSVGRRIRKSEKLSVSEMMNHEAMMRMLHGEHSVIFPAAKFSIFVRNPDLWLRGNCQGFAETTARTHPIPNRSAQVPSPSHYLISRRSYLQVFQPYLTTRVP